MPRLYTRFWQRILLIGLLVGLSPSAILAQGFGTGTIVQTRTHGAFVPFNQALIFDQYNRNEPLQSVEILISMDTDLGSFFVDNDGATASTAVTTAGSDLEISSTDVTLLNAAFENIGSGVNTLMATVTEVDMLEPDNGDGLNNIDTSPPDGMSYSGGNATDMGGDFLNSIFYPQVTGAGTYTINAESATEFSISGVGGPFEGGFGGGFFANVTVTVIYRYVPDNDGDGIADTNDLDDDNDGIPDWEEVGCTEANFDTPACLDPWDDVNADGIPNFADPTFCANGVLVNGICPEFDADGDGVPNFGDLDSDNDGITDVVEAGGSDGNGDGIVDGFTDINTNGWDDDTEANPFPNPNSDTDANPNFLDIDADNDGIVDNIEAQTTIGYVPPTNSDMDNDGIDDAYDSDIIGFTQIVPINTDMAADNPDYLDLDTDDDSVPDLLEGHDADMNGIPDNTPINFDSDGDGLDDAFDTVVNPATGNAIGTNAPLQDTDGTEDKDWRDTDDDGDFIPTSTEIADVDMDGIPDYLQPPDNDGDGVADLDDLDDDNDGILDLIESNGVVPNEDDDNDGVLNYQDADFCILSSNGVCANLDTDGDGIINQFDLDADDDGLLDVIEAGGMAATDSSGIIIDFEDNNGNGYDDDLETTPLPIMNNDTDAIPDYLDIDSDNDGIVDNIEIQSSPDYIPPSGNDTDGDGWDDAYDENNGGTPPPVWNQDGNGEPDYLDLDSDDDTVLDIVEGHDANMDGIPDVTPTIGDADGDGLDDAYDTVSGSSTQGNSIGSNAPLQDTDQNQLQDWRDLDDDGDGIDTEDELGDVNGSGIPDYLEPLDNDGDGVSDLDDLDDDNDGISDLVESNNVDATGDDDNDGTPNYLDPDFCTLNANGVCEDLDTDGDGIINQFDLDAENDGIPDVVEAGGIDAGDGTIANYTDTNDNGWDDATETAPLPVPNTDGDAIGLNDYLDIDSDDDGITDVIEGGGTGAGDGTIAGYTDANDNGYDDGAEANPLPLPNNDLDRFPDFLDIDADADGIVDNVESQPTIGYVAPLELDTDGDGWDDAYDPDNGGVPIVIENTDLAADKPDHLDTDTDNDGVADAIEGHDANMDGVSDVTPQNGDADSDGLDDVYDTVAGANLAGNSTGSNAPLQDTDGTEDKDWRDTDDDGDAIPTINEIPDANGNNIPDYLEPPDNDGDGVQDVDDLDDDNDGIPDLDESGGVDATGDVNADGIPNYQDSTFCTLNEHGVCDSLDIDGDGIIDQFDIDSDNDGIPDVTEAGGTDGGDGTVDNFTDVNGNGMDDTIESNPLPTPDFDNDMNPDYLDIDADNDGITDNVESQTTIGYIAPTGVDSDNDGWDDAYDPDNGGTPPTIPNTDATGNPDYTDLDSDDDSIPDLTEGHDADMDGIPDRTPTGNDSDNDGLDDIFDTVIGFNSPFNSTGSNSPLQDTDADGEKDWRDLDDDGDGILTVDEPNDVDQNGVPDYLEPLECANAVLELPTGITPNGDGFNDFYVINNFKDCPNTFKVYNRWGNLVFEKENYDNTWDGTNMDGQELPKGTYFIIIDITIGNEPPLQTYVDLRRE